MQFNAIKDDCPLASFVCGKNVGLSYSFLKFSRINNLSEKKCHTQNTSCMNIN